MIKIHPVEAELLDAGGRTDNRQTDITKVIASFRNFANPPKKTVKAINCVDEHNYCLKI